MIGGREMQKALRAYGEVLRLIRRLPKDTRQYYAKYARENFVNYREVDAADGDAALDELFARTYAHSIWILNKYSVKEAAAERLKEICGRQSFIFIRTAYPIATQKYEMAFSRVRKFSVEDTLLLRTLFIHQFFLASHKISPFHLIFTVVLLPWQVSDSKLLSSPLLSPPLRPRRRISSIAAVSVAVAVHPLSRMSLNSSRPSSSKSKRSRDANSSASNASNVGKKRAPIQKTLGGAWGANSPASSSRSSSFRKAPFSDFGSYMIEKNRKLQFQYEAEASTSSRGGSDSEKPIFEGVSIFVNGLTVPSSQDLRKYMLKHGGRFENYFSRHHVTHIICSNLPDSKINNPRSFSGGLPVVKPTWLATETRSQPKLSDFFVSKRAFKLKDASTVSPSVLRSVPEDLESRGMFNDEESCEVDELPVCDGQYDGKIRGPLNKGVYEAKDEPVAGDEENWRNGNVESGSCDMANSAADNELQTDLHQPSTLAVLDSPGGKFIEESSGLWLSETSHHRHSTSEDPNFVENYFKSSRLHFIGTWRNRYRKLFGILSHGAQLMGSGSTASASTQKTTIVHVDMDCFFVSVVVRNHPELRDKPVAVCHSDSPKGTAEISSANYPARDYGVKAGMFMRNAKALCPHLVIVPYDFEAYEEVADQFYNILHKHSKKVQAVSCDEAFLDVTASEEQDPETLACMIRKEIFDGTGCTASAGIAGNLLMARLATRSAKPDGQCYIPNEKVDDYLLQLPIKALPGIGHVLEQKLNKRHVQTCEQLRAISK
ncbi:DNA repair protein REV1-like protein, partial [Drosera capensis]